MSPRESTGTRECYRCGVVLPNIEPHFTMPGFCNEGDVRFRFVADGVTYYRYNNQENYVHRQCLTDEDISPEQRESSPPESYGTRYCAHCGDRLPNIGATYESRSGYSEPRSDIARFEADGVVYFRKLDTDSYLHEACMKTLETRVADLSAIPRESYGKLNCAKCGHLLPNIPASFALPHFNEEADRYEFLDPQKNVTYVRFKDRFAADFVYWHTECLDKPEKSKFRRLRNAVRRSLPFK
mmetsp:Transcript_10973/g.34926  ORF Transcript_10973/g.34926 Transcript_10973/m.34926 type:complete len:240 (+) Transcript_10973:37-756(+)